MSRKFSFVVLLAVVIGGAITGCGGDIHSVSIDGPSAEDMNSATFTSEKYEVEVYLSDGQTICARVHPGSSVKIPLTDSERSGLLLYAEGQMIKVLTPGYGAAIHIDSDLKVWESSSF